MSDYAGDFSAGSTVRMRFNTRDATGAPITLAGSPAVSVYKQGSTTESTAGVTLTVDYDSRTGYHSVSIDTSADGTFYATGNDFFAVLTAGTVSGVSVAGTEIGQFSLGNRIVASVPGAVGSVTGNVGGNVAGNVTGSVGSIATGGITAASFGADAITAAKVAADVGSEIAAAVRTELATELARIDAAISTRLATAGYTAPLDAAGVRAAVGLALANLDSQLALVALQSTATAIKAKTDNLPSDPADQSIVIAATDAILAAVNTTPSAVRTELSTELGRIDVATSTRLASASYTAPLDAAGTRSAVGLAAANLDSQLAAIPTTAGIADSVWDEVLSGHATAGTTGAALNAAGTAGDPWGVTLPGSYTGSQAGKLLSDANTAVSSLPSAATIAAAVWSAGTRTITDISSALLALFITRDTGKTSADLDNGSVAKLAQGTGNDPLTAEVPGEYDEGTLGHLLGNYINMPFSSLGAIISTLDSDSFEAGTILTIRRGEDRYNADGRPISITIRNIPDGVTFTSAVLNLVRGETTVRSTTTDITVVANVATCLFDLAGTEASQLEAGDQVAEWTAQLTLDNGHKWEPIGGPLVVLESRAQT